MNNFSRFCAILFALLLATAGISRNLHEQLYDQAPVRSWSQNKPLQLASKSLYHAFGLQPQAELVLGAPSHLPVPGSKIDGVDFVSAAPSLELGICTAISGYLYHARQISPSLAIGVIIFPFHYFW